MCRQSGEQERRNGSNWLQVGQTRKGKSIVQAHFMCRINGREIKHRLSDT